MTKCFNVKSTGAAVAVALAALAGSAQAGVPGYVADSRDQVWTTPYGLCWKTTDWDPSKAAAPCDAVARVEAPVPPPVAVAPAPAPAPQPTPLVVAPPAPAPIIEKVTLSSDVLFEFDKAQLRPQGRDELDKLAQRVKDADIEQVLTVGYADPIGNEQYNRKLSEARAEAVKQHLAQQGLDSQRIRIEGRGETDEFTRGECKGMSGSKLIACLQPNRRVDIEVRGNRQVAGTGSPSAGGSTGSSSGSSVGSGFGSTSGTPSSGGQSSPATPGSGAPK